MRLAVYTDYKYRRDDEAVYAEIVHGWTDTRFLRGDTPGSA